jgi:hypothetical protein
VTSETIAECGLRIADLRKDRLCFINPQSAIRNREALFFLPPLAAHDNVRVQMYMPLRTLSDELNR